MEAGRLAVRRGLLTEAQLKEALGTGRPLAAVLAERGWVRPEDWAALEESRRREAFDRASLARSHDVPPEARPHLDDPARNLAEFVLVSRLGRGGAGEVWKAWDRRLGRWVALKRPSSPPDSREDWERFHREAAAVARLAHPNIVPVYRTSGPDESPFIAMQYVEGAPLEGTRLPLREALETARAAALAADYAHRQGVVHRDLKPGNLIRDARGNTWVLDFGLAALLEARERITATGAAAGTPEYMSPEQARGERRAREVTTDVYGLGATLHALLSGRPPFTGGSIAEVVSRVERDDPVPPRRLDPSLPADVDTVVAKAMDKDPARRYPTAAALAEDLRRLLEGEPVVARPQTAVGRLWRKAVRHRAVAAPLAAAAIAVLAASGWALSGRLARRAEMRALSLLERARPAIEKASAALYVREADFDAHRRALGEARALVEEAVRLAPGLPLAHHRLGEAWELLGSYDHAEEAWRKATALDPRFGPAHYRLGRVLMTRAYLASLDLWHGRGIAPEGERMALEAAREIEAAQAEGSGFDHDLQRQAAAAMLAWLRRDRDTARRTCRAALDHFGNRPGSEDFHWLLGLAAEPPEDPLSAYDAAIALRPGFPLALYVRADARLQRRDYDGAVSDYDEAIRILPGFHEAFIYRATVLYQKKDAAAAHAAFTGLIEQGILLPAAYNGRGWTRIELQDDLDGGIADLGEAIRRKPEGYGLPYAERARALFRKGRHAEAAADCTKAIPLMPDWGDLRRIRARCRAALGDVEGAFEDLKALGEARGGELWKEVEEARRKADRD
jgi:tetratricopeptide (TPR) repeat protein